MHVYTTFSFCWWTLTEVFRQKNWNPRSQRDRTPIVTEKHHSQKAARYGNNSGSKSQNLLKTMKKSKVQSKENNQGLQTGRAFSGKVDYQDYFYSVHLLLRVKQTEDNADPSHSVSIPQAFKCPLKCQITLIPLILCPCPRDHSVPTSTYAHAAVLLVSLGDLGSMFSGFPSAVNGGEHLESLIIISIDNKSAYLIIFTPWHLYHVSHHW